MPGASGQPGKPGNTPRAPCSAFTRECQMQPRAPEAMLCRPNSPQLARPWRPPEQPRAQLGPAGGSGRADTRTAHGAAVARSVPREPAFNGKAEASGAASTRPGRGAAAPRRGGPAAAHSSVRPAPAKAPHQAAKVKSSSHEAAQGGAASRAPGQHLGRLRPGPLAAGRVPSSPEKQVLYPFVLHTLQGFQDVKPRLEGPC